MPPKTHSLSLLFHPKKKTKKDQEGRTQSPPKPRPKAAAPAVQKEDEEDTFQLPEGQYQEFRLLSSALNGWKYDVMKFDSRKPVEILKWTPPIKLNRKDLRREDRAAAVASTPQAVGPMVGPDGKPVIGADGKMVMVDAEGRPIHSTDGGSGFGKGKGGGGGGGRKRFQKKTRQVFLVPDEVRQLQREERCPWVMEDSSPGNPEHWIAQLEDVSKAETHAFFMPAANDAFKFVPAHRWYKFQKKLKHDLPTDTANVESLYTQAQKRDPHVWLATLNGGRGASSATSAMFKSEESKPSALEGQSLGPGNRRLKAVDSGMDSLFDEDDEDGGARKRREKELGEDGDLDEQLYEEDFADDEENMAVDDNDEEAKEVEERLKREYQMANKQRDTGVDESDDDDLPEANKLVKKMQKMIRNREGNDAYESDEDKNPYASSEEEEEEEVPVPTGPAVQVQPQQVDSRPDTPKSGARPPPVSNPNSRATSPVSSSMGGHSLVAKRATSPKAPKAKLPGGHTPPGSRATTPSPGSRATSPLANSAGPANSQANGMPKTNKRKAEDLSTPISSSNGAPGSNNQNGLAQPKLKKKKTSAGSVSTAELEAMLVEWLRNTPNATTRDCIQHFNSYLIDQEKKAEFSSMVKRVAILKNGVLALRPGVGPS